MKFERMHFLKQTVRMSKPSLVMDYSNKFLLYHIYRQLTLVVYVLPHISQQ